MVRADTLEQLEALFEKAKEKALKLNPSIFIVDIGHYRVASSKPNKFYDVYCARYFVACNCRGGLEGKNCYHGFTALYFHKEQKRQENALREKREQETALYSKTQKPSEKVGGFRM